MVAALFVPSKPDVLLRDLCEKKQNIRRITTKVGSVASYLRDFRSYLAAQDAHLQEEKRWRETDDS